MLKNYIKIAFKVMLRQKFFTAISLFGISFTIMIFSIFAGLFNLVYGENSPAINHRRIIYFDGFTLIDKKGELMYTSPEESFYEQVRKSKQVEDLFQYKLRNLSVFKKDKTVTFATAYTEAGQWKIYDYTFLEGRPYNARDIAQRQAYAVITESLRKFYFGDGPALGKYIGEDPKVKVIGVVKDAVTMLSAGTESASIWMPYSLYKGTEFANSGVILVKDKSDISLVKSQLASAVKQTQIFKMLGKAVKVSGETIFDKQPLDYVLMFIGILFFFIMVIPALNLIGLNVNRISERSSEIGIRKAFGASSAVLVAQFITENIIITFIGGVLGILLTFAVSDILVKVIYYNNPELALAPGNFLVNWDTIGYSLICILFFGVLSGIVPAWRMSRLPAIKALKGGES